MLSILTKQRKLAISLSLPATLSLSVPSVNAAEYSLCFRPNLPVSFQDYIEMEPMLFAYENFGVNTEGSKKFKYEAESYREALEESVWAKSILTDAQKEELASAQKVLYEDIDTKMPTENYKRYKNILEQISKLKEMVEEEDPNVVEDLKFEIEELEDELLLVGATKIKNAEFVVEKLSIPPSDTRDRFLQPLKLSESVDPNTGRAFYATRTDPGLDELLLKKQSKKTIVVKKLDIYEPSLTISTLKCDGPAKKIDKKLIETIVVDGMLSYYEAEINIRKDWIPDRGLFELQYWDLPAAFGILSDGVDENSLAAMDEQLPSLTESILLRWNVELIAEFSKENLTKLFFVKESKANILIGDFVFSGELDFEDEKIKLGTLFFSTNSVRTDSIFIASKVIQGTPKSPNPDLSLEC